MFEYTALVDAPVQRFTGIVTGAEPLDEQLETPLMLLAVQPETTAPEHEQSEPAAAPPAPTAHAPRAVRPSWPRVEPARTFVPRADPAPAPAPSIVPALVGIAAAGITALWWLRRDWHGRGR